MHMLKYWTFADILQKVKTTYQQKIPKGLKLNPPNALVVYCIFLLNKKRKYDIIKVSNKFMVPLAWTVLWPRRYKMKSSGAGVCMWGGGGYIWGKKLQRSPLLKGLVLEIKFNLLTEINIFGLTKLENASLSRLNNFFLISTRCKIKKKYCRYHVVGNPQCTGWWNESARL